MQIKIGVTGVKKENIPIPDTSIVLDPLSTSSINDGFHGISTQEIWKRGSSTSTFTWFEDLLTEEYVTLIKELNPSALQHPGLANSDLEFVNIGNTSLDQAVGTGGLNCDSTSGCSVQDGICCPDTNYGHPAFSNLLELSTLVSTPTRTVSVSHVMNPQLDAMVDLQTWKDQAEWKLTFCANRNIPVYNIQLGIEQNTSGNDIWWDAMGQVLNPTLPAIQTNVANYIQKIEPGVSALRLLAPDAAIFLDTSPIAETTQRDIGWRKGLVNSGVLDYDGIREYMMHHNFDSINDLGEALNIKDVVIPSRLDAINTYYSGKLVHVIYGLPDQNPTPIHDTMLGLMFIVWVVQACLDWSHNNGSKVYGMNYQSLNGLIKQSNLTRKVHFYAVKSIGNILGADNLEYVPVTLSGASTDSLTSFCTVDQNSNYYLCIINYSGIQQEFDNIMINSTEITSNLRYSVNSTSLNSGIITENTALDSKFIVPMYSINVYRF